NAARVLPLPVGAWISVCRPVEIDAQPPTWAGVGVSNADSNQALTGAEKGARGSPLEARASVGDGRLPRRAAGRVIALTRREFYSGHRISIKCSNGGPGHGGTRRHGPEGRWSRPDRAIGPLPSRA